MTKQQIIALRLRLNTIRDYIARLNLRLALRSPQSKHNLVYFGGPMVIVITIIVIIAAFGLSSCNVVRTITNKSEFYQRGDTSVMIQTKTTESYDASKKLY